METQMNSINYNIREKEEKRTQQRRRDILYLIAEYLKNRGFTKSSNMLAAEAQLTDSVHVCDNIDLEMILKSYDIYYASAYNKLPSLCKHSKGRSVVTETNNKQNENKVSKKIEQREKSVEDVSDVNLAMTVKQMFVDRPLDPESTINTLNNDSLPPISVSIENLYGDDIEMRKIAETISKEILMKKCNVRWNDVIGLTRCKVAIDEAIVYPLIYPKLFREKFSSWKGVLLYGPPGTGKTMLAKAVATECNCTFFNVSASSLVSKWRGDSEKYIRALFDLAYERAPTVIFVDEIDWIATKEDLSEPARRFRAELLAKFDGLTTDENARIVLLAATNAPWNIDSALLRRLEKLVYVPLPVAAERLEMLTTYFSKEVDYAKLQEISDELHYSSCADIKMLCKQAWLYQIDPLIKHLENNELSLSSIKYELTNLAHLQAAIDHLHFSKTREETQKYNQWQGGDLPIDDAY